MSNKTSISVDSEIKSAMKNLGFTDYYINIYIKLLSDGEMDARKLSNKTSVPYSRIYEVLNEMIRKGIINKIEGRPSTFVGVNPSEMFENLKNRMESEFSENMNRSKTYFEQIFEPTGTMTTINANTIQGIKACMLHLKNIIKNTSVSLNVSIRNLDDIFEHILPELQFLKMKHIKIQLILEGKERKNNKIKDIENFCDIKYLNRKFPIITISDESISMIIEHSKFNIAYPNKEEYLGVSVTNSNFSKIQKVIFNNLWNESK